MPAEHFLNKTGLAYLWSKIKAYVVNGFASKSSVGDITTLQTTDKSSVVGAVNELVADVAALGEPFRVKQWQANVNAIIPTCTTNVSNTNIPKMVFSISGQEGIDYQVVGMIAYEVFDAGGQRLNCWPVCQFTGNGQKELSVRWMCGGTTPQTATRISAWVLLKHR